VEIYQNDFPELAIRALEVHDYAGWYLNPSGIKDLTNPKVLEHALRQVMSPYSQSDEYDSLKEVKSRYAGQFSWVAEAVDIATRCAHERVSEHIAVAKEHRDNNRLTRIYLEFQEIDLPTAVVAMNTLHDMRRYLTPTGIKELKKAELLELAVPKSIEVYEKECKHEKLLEIAQICDQQAPELAKRAIDAMARLGQYIEDTQCFRNAEVSEYAKMKRPEVLRSRIEKMKTEGVEPDSKELNDVLDACHWNPDIREQVFELADHAITEKKYELALAIRSTLYTYDSDKYDEIGQKVIRGLILTMMEEDVELRIYSIDSVFARLHPRPIEEGVCCVEHTKNKIIAKVAMARLTEKIGADERGSMRRKLLQIRDQDSKMALEIDRSLRTELVNERDRKTRAELHIEMEKAKVDYSPLLDFKTRIGTNRIDDFLNTAHEFLNETYAYVGMMAYAPISFISGCVDFFSNAPDFMFFINGIGTFAFLTATHLGIAQIVLGRKKQKEELVSRQQQD
jgi:hypothetical protein